MASIQDNRLVKELTVAELTQLLKGLTVEPKKSKKVEGEEKPKKEVSAGVAAWNAYVGEVLEDLKKEGWTNPATGKLTRKDAMAEASKRKAAGNAEYAAASAARRAKRDEQLAKKASPKAEAEPVAASVAVVEKPSAERPKKVLSPEHLAKMKAGREAKKAASVPAPVAVTPPPAPEPVAADEEEWIRKTISGKKYLWNPSNNHCYRLEADGSQGDWAGLYDPKNKKIDDSVEEPLEFEEE